MYIPFVLQERFQVAESRQEPSFQPLCPCLAWDRSRLHPNGLVSTNGEVTVANLVLLR